LDEQNQTENLDQPQKDDEALAEQPEEPDGADKKPSPANDLPKVPNLQIILEMLENDKFDNAYVFSQALMTLLDAFSKVEKRDMSISIQGQVCLDLTKQIIEYDEIFQYVGPE